jgi:hypothetical protein
VTPRLLIHLAILLPTDAYVRFLRSFPQVAADDVYGVFRGYMRFGKQGLCREGPYPSIDANGDRWEFTLKRFRDSYDLLTFGAIERRLPSLLVG